MRRTPVGHGSIEASVGTNRNDLEIETYGNRSYSTVTTRELGDEVSDIARMQLSHSLPLQGTLRIGGTLSKVRYDETLDAQLATASAVRYEQRLSSVGAELQLPLASRIIVSGGVVRDVASTPESGGRTSLGTLERTGWRAGATALASDAVRLHASISRRARFAALRELYSGAFRHLLDDAVVRITLPDRRFRRINRDQIRSHGIEALAAWSPPALRGLSLSADATFQRIRVTDRTITTGVDDARRPEHNPEVRGSFAVTTPLVAGITGSALVRHTGAQFCQHPDLSRLVRLAPQTIADASLARAFPLRRGGLLQRIVASMALENIGNRTVYDQCGLPQPGRTFRLAFDVR